MSVFKDNCLNRNILETSKFEYIDQQGPFGDADQPNELVVIMLMKSRLLLSMHKPIYIKLIPNMTSVVIHLISVYCTKHILW